MTDAERAYARKHIDVHAHFIPDFYREALVSAGLSRPDGIHAIPPWNPETALEVMNSLGVSTAMLSISSPGVHFHDDEMAKAIARRVNVEGSRLRETYAGRFGFFASLPLPDIEGAISEATYAFDHLNADGVILESNHHGIYLGDPRLEPLYEQLDRRNAVVFIHPTSPACSCSQRLDELYPRPILEFIFETTRSVTDMVLCGVLERFPNLRIIVPHAGAVLSVLAARVEIVLPMLTPKGGRRPPSIRESLRKLHFDLAGAPVPELLGALLQVADPARIHYGSDYPFTPAPICTALMQQIDSTPLIADGLRKKIMRENALALFPHLMNQADAIK